MRFEVFSGILSNIGAEIVKCMTMLLFKAQ